MRRTLLVLLAGLALLLGGAAWLLHGGGASEGESRVLRAQRETDDARVLPAPATAADGGPEAIGGTNGADAAPPGDAPPAAAPADALPTWAFTGRVIDDAGLPLEGATVVYWPNEATGKVYSDWHGLWSSAEERGRLPRTLTGKDGRFALHASYVPETNVWSGSEDPQLAVLADGYAIRSRECRLYAGGDYDAGDIALEPGAFLAGRVLDAAGRPVAGAVVKPWNPRAHSLRGVVDGNESFSELSGVLASAASGDDGRFRCGGLWEGKVQFGISAEGFLDLWREYVDVHVGQPTDLGDIVLDAGSVLEGLVRDTSGAPVAGARVLAISTEDYRFSESHDAPDPMPVLLFGLRDEKGERTDAQGRFVVPRLPVVNHSVFVDAEGYEPAYLDNLLPGGPGLVIELVRAATLRLTVTDSVGGQPLADADVRAQRLSQPPPHGYQADVPVTSGDAPGRWLVTRLGRAYTRLSVGAPGHATQAVAIEGVRPPAQIERTVALVPESVLAGRIVGDDGVALPDIEVELKHVEKDAHGEPRKVRSDAQGGYELLGLAAGDWLLTADGPEHSPIQRLETLAAGEQRRSVDFVLPRSAEVFGTCYSDDGTPEVGVRKTFEPLEPTSGNEHREVRADATGAYALHDMAIGSWRVHGNPQREFTLASGQRLQLDLREDPESALGGRVLLADGTPASGAWVFVTAANLGEVAYMHKFMNRADDQGNWSWKPARTGRLEVVASLPNGGGMTDRLAIDLLEGEQRSVDLRIGQAGVAGRVVEQDGKPVAGARVRMLPVSEGGKSLIWGNIGVGGEQFDFGVPSSDDGKFELGHLAPGRYVADVTVKGAQAADQSPFPLAASERIELLITVTRTGRIAGRVELASGVPVHEWTVLRAVGPEGERSTMVEAGRYELTGLLPGPWSLSVLDGPKVLAERDVKLAAGEDLDVDLVVVP